MKKIISKIWNDPVGSKVLSGIILFIILGTGLINFWEMVQEGLSLIGSILTYEIGIPVWLLIIFVVAIIALIILITLIIQKNEPEEIENEQGFLKYKTDHILGIIWIWDWSKNIYINKYEITDLYPRCPECQSRLIGNGNKPYPKRYEVVMCTNDACGWTWRQSNQNRVVFLSDLKVKAEIEIDRKIYNGEF